MFVLYGIVEINIDNNYIIDYIILNSLNIAIIQV